MMLANAAELADALRDSRSLYPFSLSLRLRGASEELHRVCVFRPFRLRGGSSVALYHHCTSARHTVDVRARSIRTPLPKASPLSLCTLGRRGGYGLGIDDVLRGRHR